MSPSQNVPELLASGPLDLNLEYLYQPILETPLDTQSIQEILPNPPFFHAPDPLELPLQTPAPVDDMTSLCVVYSVSSSLPPSMPPPQSMPLTPVNWRRIPQETYDHGRKQWDFTRSESISFGVNGFLGVNMGDALRKRFTGLDGRDEVVLQGPNGVISCRLSVRLSR